MAIDSSSDTADVLAQYNNNLNWDGDPAKAALALAAVRWLLINRPATMGDGDGQQATYESLQAEKKKLELFVAQTASTSGGKRVTQTYAEF